MVPPNLLWAPPPPRALLGTPSPPARFPQPRSPFQSLVRHTLVILFVVIYLPTALGTLNMAYSTEPQPGPGKCPRSVC